MLYLISMILIIVSNSFQNLYISDNVTLKNLFFFISIFILIGYILINFNKKKWKNSKLITKNLFLCLFIIIYFYIYYLFNKSLTDNYIEIIKFIVYIFVIYILYNIGFVINIYERKNYLEKIEDWYLLWLKINIVISIIQILVFYIFRFNLSFEYQNLIRGNSFRAAGLFSEPAHMGIYGLGILCIIKNKFKDNKFIIIIFSIILIITGSPVCIIIAFSIMLKIIFMYRNKKYFIHVLICSCITFLIVFNVFMKSNQATRITNMLDNIKADQSLMVRVYKGIYIYNNMDNYEKLFGINFGNIDEIKKYIYDPQYYENFTDQIEYMSGIGYELISFGLIGFLIINIFYYKVLNAKKNKYFFIVFELMRFGINLSYMSSIMILFLILCNIRTYYRKDSINDKNYYISR